ncbi:MAG: TonB-dependent receptor, partial [Dysgonamonadaceae bacterium]|nr:TonB-dependent receptor [Dysgonamonadaceae bacterium]
ATEESASPELRGSSGDQSRVLINGVPIRNPVRNQQLNGVGNFSLFNAEIVGQQFVYPSNPPLEWGNSIGGIVYLRTTEDIDSESETNLSLSLANVGAFHSKGLGEKAFIQMYWNGQWSKLYKVCNPNSLNYLDSFSSIDGGINFRTVISDKSYINIFSYFIGEQYKSEKGLYNYYGIQQASNLRNFNIVNYRLNTTRGSIALNFGYDQSKSRYNYEIISDTTYQQNAFFSVSYKHFFNDNLSIVTGGDYEYNGYRYDGVYPHKPYNATLINNGKKCQSGNIKNNKLEAFVYGKWNIGNFTAGLSCRGIFSENKNALFSYQANVKYARSNSHSFIASFGKYHAVSIPNYYLRQMVFSSSKQASLDWHYTFSSNCNLGAAIYWKDNYIPFYKEENAESIFVNNIVMGVELSGKILWNKIALDGNYTFLRSQINNGTGKMLSHYNDFGNMLKVMVSFVDAKLFNAAISFVYRGGLHYTPIESKDNRFIFGETNSSRYSDYFSLDLSLNKYIKCGRVDFIPYIAITNITNRSNQKYFYYDKLEEKRLEENYLHRLVYFGCTLRF